MTMNDKALYQLERAIDALTEMAKYLKEEKTSDSIVFSSSNSNYYDPDWNISMDYKWHE